MNDTQQKAAAKSFAAYWKGNGPMSRFSTK